MDGEIQFHERNNIMNSRLKILSAGLAATLFAGTALAADVIEPDPTPPPPEVAYENFTWGGFYVGGQLGYGTADTSVSAGGVSASGDADGFLVGGFAGYNWQFDNIVVGIEGDLSYADLDASSNIAGVTGDADVDYVGTIGPRLGYAIDRTLLYVEGGYAFANIGADLTTVDGRFDDDSNASGYFVGAGVDYAFTDNIFLGAEYNYADFGSETLNFGGTDVNVGDTDAHIFKGRVGFKF